MEKEAVEVFLQIGTCYRLSQEYPKSIKNIKKVLQKAWVDDDKQLEMKAFENLAYEHFHMGHIGKCKINLFFILYIGKYYAQRFIRGQSEPKDSVLRKLYIQDVRAHSKMTGDGDHILNSVDSKLQGM